MLRFSIIVPTYRRPAALNLVLRSFLEQHPKLHELVEIQVIVVEGDPISETRAVLRGILDQYGDRLLCVHLTTSAFGYVQKVIDGFRAATGDYVLTLTDEDFTQYDFLTPIFPHAREDTVYPVLFTGSGAVRKVYAAGYPSYFRHGVPAFPHYVCSRSVFARIFDDVAQYRHYIIDHHIPLACWEWGLRVVFVADFLRLPPLLHMDAAHEGGIASGPTPDLSAVSLADRALFRKNWPLDRRRAAVAKMVDALVAASAGGIPGVGVARCRDEYFLARPGGIGANSLAPYYSWITTPIAREQLASLLSEERLSTPRWSSEPEPDDGLEDPPGRTLRARVSRRLRAFVVGGE